MTKKNIINKLKDLGITNFENSYENLKEWLYLNGTRLYNISSIEFEKEECGYIICQINLIDGYGESFGSVQYSFSK